MAGTPSLNSPAFGGPQGSHHCLATGSTRTLWKQCRMRETSRLSVMNSAARSSTVNSVLADVAKDFLVPIGGCYRLIDVPMSNCINSGINKIYVLTQFNSQSLNCHLAQTYNLGNGVNFGDGFVEVLAAMQTPGESGMKWVQGTADAARQFIWLFEDAKLRDIENILILSGDHLYRMDYMNFVQIRVLIYLMCVPVMTAMLLITDW